MMTLAVTAASPDRVKEAGIKTGQGYEVSHWVVVDDQPVNLHEKDKFFPAIEEAVQWVAQTYPAAKCTRLIKDKSGSSVIAAKYEVPDESGVTQQA